MMLPVVARSGHAASLRSRTACAALAGLLLASALLAGTGGAAAQQKSPQKGKGGTAEPALKLEGVTVHLFLEDSGSLSDDAAGTPGISGGISGANMRAMLPGNREEPFHDFLIKVALSTRGEAFVKGRQGTITIIDANKKRTLETHAIDNVYVSAKGRTVRPLWVRNRMCQTLDVRVAIGGQVITKRLNFHCGE